MKALRRGRHYSVLTNGLLPHVLPGSQNSTVQCSTTGPKEAGGVEDKKAGRLPLSPPPPPLPPNVRKVSQSCDLNNFYITPSQ